MKCKKCGVNIDKYNWGTQGFSPKGKEENYCSQCIEKSNIKEYKKLKSNKDKVMALVDDEIYTITKKAETHFNLSWKKARDFVNESIRDLFDI